MLPYSKKWRCHFFDTLARPGTVWFRASLRLRCIVSGERAAPPVLVGVDVIRRAEVRFAPQQHVVQHRQKALAHGREGVLHPGRNLGIDLPVEKAVGLQLAELPGQGGLSDAVQAAQQRPEALYPVEGHIPQDQDFPLPAEHRLQAAHGKAAGQRLRRLEFVVCHCVPSLS